MEDLLKAAALSQKDLVSSYRKLVTLEFLGIKDQACYAARQELQERTKVLQTSIQALQNREKDEKIKLCHYAGHT